MKGNSEETSIENKGREWLWIAPVELNTLPSLKVNLEGKFTQIIQFYSTPYQWKVTDIS